MLKRTLSHSPSVIFTFTALSLISCCLPLKVLASPYQSQGPFVIPAPGPIIPTPNQVPGKEFSDNFDRDSANNLDSLQVIAWDGVGGTADTFDYDGQDIFDFNAQVDALANLGDTLFREVTTDSSALLFSVENDPNIYSETINNPIGDIWSLALQIDDTNEIFDVDGLEVWGLDGGEDDDSNRFSLVGDPIFTGAGKTSVFAYDSDTSEVVPYINTSELATAVGVPLADFDLDAMMTFDLDLDAEFETGDMILFSIMPVDLSGDGQITEDVNEIDIDGGEIYLYEKGVGVSFLEHGGHLWDTEFDVTGTFDLDNENVNALEAVSTVPEPNTILGAGIVLGFKFLVRKK